MNKQEVIEKLQPEAIHHCGEKECYKDGCTKNVELDIAIDIVNQLDEPVKPPEPEPWQPEKPIVPQYVADWYEESKDDFENSLAILIRDYFKGEIEDDNLLFWFGYDLSKDQPIKTLVNMHQFGYEVEKEKLYSARLKIITKEKFAFINRNIESGGIFIDDLETVRDKFQVHFTQTELEELNVWDNPAFEIEEVEE